MRKWSSDFINKIICGDCLEVMQEIPDKSIDAIITDLPYGTTACKWDVVIPFDPMWTQIVRILMPRGVFVTTASQPFTSMLVMSNLGWFKYSWIWRKSISTGFNHANNMPLKNYEDVLVFSGGIIQHRHLTNNRMNYNPQGLLWVNKPNKRRSKGFSGTMERKSQTNNYATKFTNYPRMVLEFNNDGNTVHPTQKPELLFEYLIKTYTNEGNLVLDFCIGSGTTAVACKNTNRNFIGIDISPEYCEIARKRIQEGIV